MRDASAPGLRDTSPIPIRRATAGDAAALAAFGARLFHDTYGPDADPASGGGCAAEDVEAYVAVHFTPERQRRELADPTLATFVAVVPGASGEGDRLAGYARLARPAHPGDDAELSRLYVDAALRGRGVARSLVEAVGAAAREAGATRLRLSVFQRNTRAVAFYRRLGFAVAGTLTFPMGRVVHDDWLMVRPLASTPA